MPTPAQTIAADASFQTFVNCYLREIDAGAWQTSASWQASSGVRLSRGETHVVELDLPSQGMLLAFGVSYRSRVARHTLTSVILRRHGQREWRRMDTLSAELWLIDAIYARQPECEQRLELIGRVIESHQTMAEYVRHHLEHVSDEQRVFGGFIASEQSVALGHWLHPIPKSRQGMAAWQHAHYAPEPGGRFQLHFFAARRTLVVQESLRDATAAELSLTIARAGADAGRCERVTSELGEGFCLLPIHPLQAHWLLHQDYVRELLASGDLVDVGRLGPEFTPTSSVRTIYCETLDVMLKLAIPVKITNSLRINLATELGDSVWISKLIEVCDLAGQFPELRSMEDPAYISVALPDREESGFEVIFRSNPFVQASDTPLRTVHSIAALTQDPVREGSLSTLSMLVRRMAERHGLSLEQASRRWFDAYWRCSVEAPVRIYDQYGISLEAHQQNALVEFDQDGVPLYGYYRDIQGLALSECFRDELIARVPQLEQQHKVFEADDIVRQGFGYYLFFNHVIAVVNRFGLDGLLDEDVLVGVIRQKLGDLRAELRGLGPLLIDGLLEREAISCKGNLLTRIADMDELQSENELAVYVPLDNPFCATPRRRATQPPGVPGEQPETRAVS